MDKRDFLKEYDTHSLFNLDVDMLEYFYKLRISRQPVNKLSLILDYIILFYIETNHDLLMKLDNEHKVLIVYGMDRVSNTFKSKVSSLLNDDRISFEIDSDLNDDEAYLINLLENFYGLGYIEEVDFFDEIDRIINRVLKVSLFEEKVEQDADYYGLER